MFQHTGNVRSTRKHGGMDLNTSKRASVLKSLNIWVTNQCEWCSHFTLLSYFGCFYSKCGVATIYRFRWYNFSEHTCSQGWTWSIQCNQSWHYPLEGAAISTDLSASVHCILPASAAPRSVRIDNILWNVHQHLIYMHVDITDYSNHCKAKPCVLNVGFWQPRSQLFAIKTQEDTCETFFSRKIHNF